MAGDGSSDRGVRQTYVEVEFRQHWPVGVVADHVSGRGVRAVRRFIPLCHKEGYLPPWLVTETPGVT